MELTPLATDLSLLKIGESGSVRAEGLHASTIYSDLYADIDPKRYRKSDTGPAPETLEVGLIFERMLEEGIARRILECDTTEQIERPGEFAHEDTFEGRPFTIFYNPDLLIFNGCLRVGEIKATWMSSGLTAEEYTAYLAGDTDLIDRVAAIPLNPKFDKYFSQIKFYCHMLGALDARLIAFFVCGGYKPLYNPQLLVWDVHFAPDETEMEYSVLISHAASKGMI